MQTSTGAARLRFAQFELDRQSGELFLEGRRVRLQEHPRQVLITLLERPGEIVTREDLRLRLWTSDTFVDFEHGLNTAVRKARQALADSADAPIFIETVARRGYRFIAPVEWLDSPDASLATGRAAGNRVPPAAPHQRRRRAPIVWAAAVLVAVASAGAWMAQRESGVRGAPASRPSGDVQIAVMPLRVLSDSAGAEGYLGVGIADAITTRLANTREIAVRPTSAVLPFSAAQSEPARVASSLGVQHLLLGTIQPAGETYRVSLQLVGADGVATWGRTFDEPRTGLLQLQDQLAEQVVAALRLELSAPARARLRVRHTDNLAAHEMYLRGRSLLLNYTEANIREAIGYFEQALRLDPGYTLARAGVATACAWFSVRYAHEAEQMTWANRAEEEARRTLEQDGALAEAHLAIASAAGTTYGGFKWNVVLERTGIALALDRSQDLAHLTRMRAYYHMGLFEESRREGRLAQALNPASSVEFERLEVAVQLFGGQFREAVAAATTLLSRTDAPAIRHYLGIAKYYAGDGAGARETLGALKRGNNPDVRSQASLASIEAALGMKAEARARVATILRGSEPDHHVAYSLGSALAQLGDVPGALSWLERAADTGFPCLPWYERDTLLDPLRQHPRFARLVARLRTQHEDARRLARAGS